MLDLMSKDRDILHCADALNACSDYRGPRANAGLARVSGSLQCHDIHVRERTAQSGFLNNPAGDELVRQEASLLAKSSNWIDGHFKEDSIARLYR